MKCTNCGHEHEDRCHCGCNRFSTNPKQPPTPSQSVRELAELIQKEIISCSKSNDNSCAKCADEKQHIQNLLQSFLAARDAETVRVLDQALKVINAEYHECKTCNTIRSDTKEAITTHLAKLKE